MAVIGDTGQFVTTGKKRISHLTDSGTVQLTVEFAGAESARTILVYSSTAPHARTLSGSILSESYDQASGRYTVTLAPSAQGNARLQLSRGPMGAVQPRPGHPGRPIGDAVTMR